jgi:hypothetical protein
MGDLLPLDCELFELTDSGAAHWLVMDGWTRAEAALLLCGANPKRISVFDAEPDVLKPDFTTAGYVGIFDRLGRAAEMGVLKFPAAPADVVRWAASKHWVPDALLPQVSPSPEPAPPAAQVPPPAPTMGEPEESTTDRQDRRLAACLAAGLTMPVNDYEHLPNGVGKLAGLEGVTRQAFSQDVKAALTRQHAKVRAGVTRHSRG